MQEAIPTPGLEPYPPSELPSVTAEAYSGIDVLEIMAEAKNYTNYLTSLIDTHLHPGITVVDFGAGSGTFALPLVQRGLQLVCVEPDAILCARLRSAGARVVTELDQLPSESVDFIYTLNVLEHISDDAEVVRGFYSKLKPGGTVLIYVPAFELLYSSFDRRVGHRRRYNRKSLYDLVERAGFRITDIRYADSAGFLLALAYRALKRKDGDVSATAVKLYDRFVFRLSVGMDTVLSGWIGKNLVLIAKKSS